eukprot:TRINITY_DN24078_c0_g1_i2.p1 TRINITY_DN24078_c0_g1~~TRINITY_DN24078_c0_g1_i2.p1  ORF type:complete len:210 (-),score=43.84 TRINITY_DN24078_c0_g1_i2:36-665(-)
MGCLTSSPAERADTKVPPNSQNESNLQIDLGEHTSSSSQHKTLGRLPGTCATSSTGAVAADPEVLNLSDIDPVVDSEVQQATEKTHDAEPALTPAMTNRERSDEQVSVGDSGSDFNSWSYDSSQKSISSRERPPKPASAKEHQDHISRLDDFLADVSSAPEGLKRHVKSRRSEDSLRRHIQDRPLAEVEAAPQPGVRPAEDHFDGSLSE